ncbi:putative endonuclease [Crossiella equi]|uniref:UPF0102 protein JOF53_005937 n=2 Tax=Crossiella equi TaxID=130796 RepID=A0ABS5AKG8_9PSEU|nr:YraN family protein [Crossiella equi]MBP2477065.1 putative endonuclease [Crossiella equi]
MPTLDLPKELHTRAATHKATLGRRGEALAAEYLTTQEGLTILDTRWHCRHGELDLIATDNHILVVCEVKTRTTATTPATAALTDAQLRRIQTATRSWLEYHRMPWVRVRLDLIAITWPPGETPIIDHRRDIT